MRALWAEDELQRLLMPLGAQTTEVNHAFLGRGDDARAAWAAFKALAAIPADEPSESLHGDSLHVDVARDGDLLMFETTTGEPGEPGEPTVFSLNCTRQFSFEDADGEYLGMNGLMLTVEFPLSQELERLELVRLWGCGGPPWTEEVWHRRGEKPRPFAAALEWVDEAECSESFVLAFAGPATGFFLEQSDY